MGIPKVRVVDETGKQIGVMDTQDALRLARERGLDLIGITDSVDPPVCKIMEYGKYLYQQEKKERATKQKIGRLKTIQLSFNISPHDIQVKANQAEKFLQKGDKVMLAVRLKGRQNALQDFAKEKIQKFLEILGARTSYKVERDLKKEPGGFTMIITKA
jgi:translation initiation factor IF-3